MRKHTTTGCPVTCECGKLVAVERNGRFFVKCKGCGRQVEIKIEPRSQEDESHYISPKSW